MSLNEIYSIEKEMRNKYGSFILDELIPYAEKIYEIGMKNKITPDNELTNLFGWKFWVSETINEDTFYNEVHVTTIHDKTYNIVMNDSVNVIEHEYAKHNDCTSIERIFIHYESKIGAEDEYDNFLMDDIKLIKELIMYLEKINRILNEE